MSSKYEELQKHAEAEVMPSSLLLEVEVGVEATFTDGWYGEVKTRANLSQV